MALFDLVVAGGTIVDGSGSAGYRADVGIVAENISAIGNLSDAQTRRVIDATGLVVSPGFIDTHTHSEGALLVDPQHANGLRQSVGGMEPASSERLIEEVGVLNAKVFLGLLRDEVNIHAGLVPNVDEAVFHYRVGQAINNVVPPLGRGTWQGNSRITYDPTIGRRAPPSGSRGERSRDRGVEKGVAARQARAAARGGQEPK